MATTDWWNDNYIIRRPLRVIPSSRGDEVWGVVSLSAVDFEEVEGPLLDVSSYNTETKQFEEELYYINNAENFTYGTNKNKYRSDHRDLVVAYYNADAATPGWEVLNTHVTTDVSFNDIRLSERNIIFKLKDDHRERGIDDNYYLYMSNPKLIDAAIVAPDSELHYASNLTEAVPGSKYITMTRPQQHWVDGYSDTVNAKLFFDIHTNNDFTVTFRKGPNRGIVEYYYQPPSLVEIIKDFFVPPSALPNSYAKTRLDLYSASEGDLVETISNQNLEERTLIINVTGDKNPASSGIGVELNKITYNQLLLVDNLGEEINENAGTKSTYSVGK